MRLLGQRPRYQEGPPEGAGLVGLPPLGAEEAEDPISNTASSSPPDDMPSISTASPPLPTRSERRSRQKARRIAGSSSGRTARGRGFMNDWGSRDLLEVKERTRLRTACWL